MSDNLCPTGCGRPRPPGKLACLHCWREVPKHLQEDVYRTWGAYQRGDASDFAAFEAYTAARDAAIASVP